MTETALVLTELEWEHLAAICGRYADETSWIETERGEREREERREMLRERRALALRVVEACDGLPWYKRDVERWKRLREEAEAET